MSTATARSGRSQSPPDHYKWHETGQLRPTLCSLLHSSTRYSTPTMLATSILTSFFISLSSFALPHTSPANARDTTCSAYTLINARGTYEPQAESGGFLLMNQRILSQLPKGGVYNVVFPASPIPEDNILPAAQDILREIECKLNQDPEHCFILQGYSLGATVTISTLPNITGPAFDAVRGLFVIGNPVHTPGLGCNFDNALGTSTRNTTGFLAGQYPGIPEDWVSKTLDICIPVS